MSPKLSTIALFAMLGGGTLYAQTQAPPDSLGRNTPRSTMVRFLETAHSGNYAAASQYLESATPGAGSKEDIARMLAAVIDRELNIELNDVSNDGQGVLSDGLTPDRELIGRVTAPTGTLGATSSIDIAMHRQNSGEWLFAAETLQAIPAVYSSLSTSALERLLPSVLTKHSLFNVALWRWLALALLLPIAIVVAWASTRILVRVACKIATRSNTTVDDALIRIISGPATLCLTVLLFHMGMAPLDLPYLLRWFFHYGEIAVFVTSATWFLLRVVDLASQRVTQALVHRNRAGATSIVPLGRRVIKALLIFLAFLALLDNLGFDSRAVLAGLGVGGIAIALAAQKTLENLFGGGSVVFDQPVRVGDFCKFGDSVGTVEDIGLRSTRIRTLDRTIISIPNSQFASLNLENFAPREKMWFHPVIKVRLDTTPAQLRDVLARVRQLLEQDARLEKGARIRFVSVSQSSLDLEIFAYVLTADGDRYLEIQEELLLKLLEIVESAGATLAVPNQIEYPPPAPYVRKEGQNRMTRDAA